MKNHDNHKLDTITFATARGEEVTVPLRQAAKGRVFCPTCNTAVPRGALFLRETLHEGVVCALVCAVRPPPWLEESVNLAHVLTD